MRNEEKGGAVYPLEPRGSRFRDVGVNVRVLQPGKPNALYRAESGQEGLLVLWGRVHVGRRRGTTAPAVGLVPLSPDTRHVFVGAGNEACAILMIGCRPKSRPCSTR